MTSLVSLRGQLYRIRFIWSQCSPHPATCPSKGSCLLGGAKGQYWHCLNVGEYTFYSLGITVISNGYYHFLLAEP